MESGIVVLVRIYCFPLPTFLPVPRRILATFRCEYTSHQLGAIYSMVRPIFTVVVVTKVPCSAGPILILLPLVPRRIPTRSNEVESAARFFDF